MDTPATPFTLRSLPFAARLTLAAFLVSVGVGYASALVQLHFQHAAPGNMLPTKDDVRKIYNGAQERPACKIERLVLADESLTLNGTGQMSAAFTTQTSGWKQEIRKRAQQLTESRRDIPDAIKAKAEEILRKERHGERFALVAWIRAGADEMSYNEDSFCLPDDLADQPITEDYLVKDANDKPVLPRRILIHSLINDRCGKCHTKGAHPQAGSYPLDEYAKLKPYLTVKQSDAISKEKLAQTTHVHLLGFSMLYGLTGLFFALTSYPGIVRVLIAPLPLAAQVLEISCWWLARLNPLYADAIAIFGGIVAVGLLIHILFGLWDLFGKGGKLVLFLMFIGFVVGGLVAKDRISNYLELEKAGASAQE
jgi:hypothetical protein